MKQNAIKLGKKWTKMNKNGQEWTKFDKNVH